MERIVSLTFYGRSIDRWNAGFRRLLIGREYQGVEGKRAVCECLEGTANMGRYMLFVSITVSLFLKTRYRGSVRDNAA